MASAYQRSSSAQRSNSGYGSREAEANASLMEEGNNAKWAELSDQVSRLKDLSRDIHQEVQSQNSFLDDMGKSFGATNDLFKSTISKLGNMIESGGSGHMIYLVVFILFVFFLLYFLMTRK